MLWLGLATPNVVAELMRGIAVRDLRVDDHPQPIDQRTRLLRVHTGTFG